MAAPHYKAFISYSHQDEAWARWLQAALERYRVPRRLVGTTGAYGPIPRRLNPIFRDRADLSSAPDLTRQIRDELSASETLIVICSPSAAQSRWVNEEVRFFSSLGRSARILALIVAGDPQAAAPAEACFPPALVESADGSRHEPLAADVRRYADGKALARLKLVAGILGIRLDELKRREAQRRLRHRLAYSLVSLLLIGGVGWLVHSAATSREAARTQRTNTEVLLEFMLGSLKQLDPIVGLELLDEDDPRFRQLREELGFSAMSDEELVTAALEWRDLGNDAHQRKALTPALDWFEKSRAAFVELHQREGGTRRSLYELGQAEFWVGYVLMDQGDLDGAQLSFSRYGAVTRRLINADPNDDEMVMELSYSLINLGALEKTRQSPDSSRVLQLFQSAVQYNQMALVLEPGNDVYRQDLATSLAFLADAWLDSCDLGNAFEFRSQGVALTRELYQADPASPRRKRELAYMLSGLATVQQQMGLSNLAGAGLTESGRLLRELHASEPGNARYYWESLLRGQRLVRLWSAEGRVAEAWKFAQPLLIEVDAFLADSPSGDFLMAVDAAQFRLDIARLALQHGLAEEGRAALERAVAELAALVRQNPGHRGSLFHLAKAGFEHWRQFGGLPGGGVADLLDGYLAGSERAQNCADAALAAQLAVLRGDLALASSYTQYVLGKGYFEPDFVSFCRAYGLCDLEPGGRSPLAADATEIPQAQQAKEQ